MTLSPSPAGKAASSRATVLLVEDTPSLQLVYRSVLLGAGYQVVVAGTAADALARYREDPSRIVLLDLVLPDRDGLDLMHDLFNIAPDTQVVVMTAHGSVKKAVEAMRAGAHEFLVKPFDETRLLNALANVKGGLPLQVTPAAAASSQNGKAAESAQANSFIGSSEPMQRIHAKIASVAKSMATVFITGESGTGKELCALAVHERSPRREGPFIALNCGAIPQDLLESEVFGHMKGSFTGAISDKPGAATAADGGTLFLDEVCEMSPPLQTKLLRFLQTSTVVPVGATKPRKVNVRIVCATNQDPAEAVRRGQFRADLFYRLYVVPIHMPPLRDRMDDVLEIATAALARFSQEEGKVFDGLDPEVRNHFRSLSWPGNVRQVLNVIRNIVVLNDGGLVHMGMLPETLSLQEGIALASATDLPQVLHRSMDLADLMDRPLAEVERIVIEATLDRHGGSVPKAARVLALSPSTLYRKIETWGGTQT